MEYNIENTLLTDREIEVVKQKADDKLVDVLSSLIDESSHTFYGDFRLNIFTNNIMNLQNEISKMEELLVSLKDKNYHELRKLGSKYKIKRDPNLKLDKVLLTNEVEKAITIKLNELRDKVNDYANAYTTNYKQTIEYFINDKISKLEKAIAVEHNLDNLNKYKYLRENFKNLNENLKTLHFLIDKLSAPITLLNDYKEELIEYNEKIKENQKKLNETYDYNEIVELEKEIKEDTEKRADLKKSIEIEKENVINAYASGDIQLDFASMRTEFLRCMLNITSNSKEAFDNGILDKEDFFTVDKDGKEIDKCSRAFHSFFYEIIEKEFDYKNYLDENEISLDTKFKPNTSRFFNHPYVKQNIEQKSNNNEEKEVKLEPTTDKSNEEVVSKEPKQERKDVVSKNDKDKGVVPDPNYKPFDVNEFVDSISSEEVTQDLTDNANINDESGKEPNNNLPTITERQTYDLSGSFQKQTEELASNDSQSKNIESPSLVIPPKKANNNSDDKTFNSVGDLLNFYETVQPNANSLGDRIVSLKGLYGAYDVDGNLIVPVEQDSLESVVEILKKREASKTENDAQLNDSFNIVYSDSLPAVVEPEEDDNYEYTYRDAFIAFCNETGEKMVNKVVDIKDNAIDKIISQKEKVKRALVNVKENIFTNAHNIYMNDRNKYDEIKRKFTQENIFIQAKAKLEEMKKNIINEYNNNHGGRDL